MKDEKAPKHAKSLVPKIGIGLSLGALAAVFFVLSTSTAASAAQDLVLAPKLAGYQTGWVYFDCSQANPVPGNYGGYAQLFRSGCQIQDDWFSYDISTFDHKADLLGATLTITFWPTGNNCPAQDWSIRPLNLNPDDYITGRPLTLYNHIEANPNWDSYTNSQNTVRTFDASNALLNYFRQGLADGNQSLRFAVVQTSTCANVYLYTAFNLSLTLHYDNLPPTVPTVYHIGPWCPGQVGFSWNESTDAGAGLSGYLAAWSTDSSFAALGGTTGWLDTNTRTIVFKWLPPGPLLYFAVKARDFAGFESNWSTVENCTVDIDPPTTPGNLSVVPIQATDWFTVSWDASTDEGSGIWGYSVAWDLVGQPTRYGVNVFGATSWLIHVDPSEYDQLHFVTVTAHDFMPWASGFNTAYFMVDSLPPSNVTIVPEPTFSPGVANTIEWAPSLDTGIGGVWYIAEASVDLSFVPLLSRVNTTNLSVTFTGLQDGQKVYYRVQALDAFGHPSPWAITYSTQDNDPPLPPTVGSVPKWTITDHVEFSWEVAANSEPVVDGSWRAVRGGGLRFTESQGVTTGSDRITLNISHGETLHFCVSFRDVAGLWSNESCVDTTADFEPPHTAISPTNLTSVLYSPGRLHFEGTARDDGSGVALVEYSETTNHSQWWPVNGEEAWRYTLTILGGSCDLYRESTLILFVRATDFAGNVEENPPWTAIRWVVCPVPLRITSPADASWISGSALVVASAPASQGNATLQYQRAGGDWVAVDVVSEPPTPGSTNIVLVWDTTTVEDGHYLLRVALKSGNATVPLTVIVANARIGLLAGDLLVDPTSPKAGGAITLRVHPVNMGSGIPAPTWMNWTIVTPNHTRTYSRLLNAGEMNGGSRFATDLVELDLAGSDHFHIEVTFASDDPLYHASFSTGEIYIEPAAAPPGGNNNGAISTGSSADAAALLLGAIGALLGAAGIVFSIIKSRPGPEAGVERVSNPKPSSGGADAESAGPAKGQEPSTIQHRDR